MVIRTVLSFLLWATFCVVIDRIHWDEPTCMTLGRKLKENFAMNKNYKEITLDRNEFKYEIS